MANRPYVFYALVVATALLALALAEQSPSAAGARSAGPRRGRCFCSRSRCRSPISRYRTSTGLPLAASAAEPTYSYEAAHENPTAFAMWWFYYLNEWIRDDGIRRSIEMPDPQHKLPFVMIPGASGRMFDTTIKINNLGFRGPDLPRDKGDAYPHFRARRVRRPSARRCAMAKSRGPNCCRTCSTGTPRAAAKSRSSTPEPRPTRSRTIWSGCAATSCRSSPI